MHKEEKLYDELQYRTQNNKRGSKRAELRSDPESE
jgi:hypothetical protein